ncbi:MAG: class I SAM-dependent methyltransferase [Planctomycetaceae bacterium]
MAEFDQFATDYRGQLRKGLDMTGESPDYFAARRVEVVASFCLREPRVVLDFGCGTGGSLALLRKQFPQARIMGFDPSQESLEMARRNPDLKGLELINSLEGLDRCVDLVFCNGVFHHIDPVQRGEALSGIRRAMSSNGRFAFWENNPWNPGTRLVMSRIPFDRDAKTLSVLNSRRLLRANGFRIIRTEHHFWFPKMLSMLRFLEPALIHVPLAGQYLVVCEKDDVATG